MSPEPQAEDMSLSPEPQALETSLSPEPQAAETILSVEPHAEDEMPNAALPDQPMKRSSAMMKPLS